MSLLDTLFDIYSSNQLPKIKVGLSSSKTICFICFNGRPLKMMKKVFFYFFISS